MLSRVETPGVMIRLVMVLTMIHVRSLLSILCSSHPLGQFISLLLLSRHDEGLEVEGSDLLSRDFSCLSGSHVPQSRWQQGESQHKKEEEAACPERQELLTKAS